MKKAMIAMSGGVDSSVAAYLTQQAGYECTGVTMRLFDNAQCGEDEESGCCSLADVEDARSVAFKLGMRHYTFNFTEIFTERVIRPFVEAYEKGITPNPCIDCNRCLKFEKMFQRMQELQIDYLVTGHYARIEPAGEKFLLKKAVDPGKDQSYVLYMLTQDQLKHLLFPLGCLTKDETRAIAREMGFINAGKHDSQDICFVPDGDYAAVIERHTGRTYPKGPFVDLNGKVLGEHRGIIHYTVGQRKGLGIAAKEPLYVQRIIPEQNTVVLGSNAALFTHTLTADRFNWVSGEIPDQPLRVKAKIRYRAPEQWATVTVTGPDTVEVVFDEKQRAITRGQAVVLYDGDVVVGGGTITGVIQPAGCMEPGKTIGGE